MKAIRLLENRIILLKRTTRKNNTEKGEFVNFVRLLLIAGLPLMKNVLTPLAEIILVPLVLTVAASVTDAAIQNKIFDVDMATLIFSNEEMDDIMKIVKSFQDAGLLIKNFSETVENEEKNKKEDFQVSQLLHWKICCQKKGVIRTNEAVVRSGKNKRFLTLRNHLTKFEI